ncbi:MAG: tetratricopeptide repeat protein [Acidobacteriota bacterium]|nr:tetratricopeptide repeat protein [Acidobacteriota bacterium]
MFASQPRLVTLILLLPFVSLNIGAAAAQDPPGGASIVFIQHPRNPLVRRTSEHSPTQGRGQAIPASGKINANDTVQVARESTNAIEDALDLGNSARETKPPRYIDSEKAYKLAAKLNPKDPRPYIGLANIWYDQKHYEEAARMYRRAASLSASNKIFEPDFTRRSGRGSLPSDTSTANALPGRPARVSAVTDITMQTGALHAYLGNALLQRKKFPEAEIELKNATFNDPDNAEWHALLGFSLFRQKRYAEASKALKAAVILEPDNARYKEILREFESREEQ